MYLEKIVPEVFEFALQKQFPARIRHDLPDSFPLGSGITMNSTVLANWLFIVKWTEDTPLYGVEKQCRTIRTEQSMPVQGAMAEMPPLSLPVAP